MSALSMESGPTVHPGLVATDVHVVTVTHNSATTARAYVSGLLANSSRIRGLTLVDNNSSDESVEILRDASVACAFPVEIISNANTGFAGGYAAAARSTIDRAVPVLCLNPDVILASGAVDALLDVLNSFPDSALVTMPLVESDGTPDSASRRRLPTLGAAMLYSVLGRFTPKGFRYNAREGESGLMEDERTVKGLAVSRLEATTGALMLINPGFKSLDDGIFDEDYWMYGEDLQLCADARAAGRPVLIAETAASTHVKGVSSGRPRSRRSNRAFHDAMMIYARKNLLQGRVALGALKLAVELHFHLKEVSAIPARLRRLRVA